MAKKCIIFNGVAFMVLFLLASMEVEGAPKKAAKKTGVGAVPGGKEPEKPADAKIKKLVDRLKKELKEDIAMVSTGRGNPLTAGQIDKLDAISFRSQIVSGILYTVKLLVNEGKNQSYWHAVIYEQEWTETLVVNTVEGPKEAKDPIK